MENEGPTGVDAFLDAARAGDLETLAAWKSPLQQSTDRSLIAASAAGRLDVVRHLIDERGANPNGRNDFDDTPLHEASKHGFAEIVEYLLSLRRTSSDSCHAGVNASNILHRTPLHEACSFGHVRVVRLLVGSGDADLHVKDGTGQTPLHQACLRGRLEVVKYLFEQLPSSSASPSNKNSCAAAINDTDKWGMTPLHCAVSVGHSDTVKYLLSAHGPSICTTHAYKWMPLHLACSRGDIDVIKIIVSSSVPVIADVNARDSYGNTPIQWACVKGRYDTVTYLLTKHNVSLQTRDYRGQTLLHKACVPRGHGAFVYIAERWAELHEDFDINVRDDVGCTPLHIACHFLNVNIVESAVSRWNASICARNNAGRTPLHTVAQTNSLQIVRFLIESAGDVQANCILNLQDGDGNTPLHLAYMHRPSDVTRYIWNTGIANPCIKNNSGQTPLEEETVWDHDEIIEHYLRHRSPKFSWRCAYHDRRRDEC